MSQAISHRHELVQVTAPHAEVVPPWHVTSQRPVPHDAAPHAPEPEQLSVQFPDVHDIVVAHDAVPVQVR